MHSVIILKVNSQIMEIVEIMFRKLKTLNHRHRLIIWSIFAQFNYSMIIYKTTLRFPQNQQFKRLIELIELQSIINKTNSSMIGFLFTSIILSLMTNTLQLFCSSACADYISVCYNETPLGCYACSASIYSVNANLSSPTPCQTLTQISILANELPNLNMTLTGYESSQSAITTCSIYTFSGKYTSQDFLSKNFTSLPLNHYALTIRYNVGYIGSWSNTDSLRLTLQDDYQSIIHDYSYHCNKTENICSQVGFNSSDCIRIQEYTMAHNSSFLFVNFSSLTSETNPSLQFWGIKELMIVAKLCHDYCFTCYGPDNNNCLSCAQGYFLQGSICQPTCNDGFYTLSSKNMCVTNCPSSFYGSINLTDNSKTCHSCVSGCILCSGLNSCQAWSNQSAYVPNLWKDKMEFWILIIILLLSSIALGIYKIFKKNVLPNEIQEKMIKDEIDNNPEKLQSNLMKADNNNGENIQSRNNISNQNVDQSINHKKEDNFWFDQLIEINPSEVVAPVRRKKIPKLSAPNSCQQEITARNYPDTMTNIEF